MWKRIALLGAIAALTTWNPSNAAAQVWGNGWGGGVTVTVAGFPGPFPFRRPCCHHFVPRPVWCCHHFVPRVWCCNRPYAYYGDYGRPLYYYGDRFAPFGYNWNVGYDGYGYDGYDYDYDE